MKLNLTHYALAGTLCLAGACGGQKSPPGNKVNLSAKPSVSNAAHANTNGTDRAICATFTLTPYSGAATSLVQAGPPVSFATTSGSTYTDQILGCTAATAKYVPPAGANTNGQPVGTAFNWAYLVSANTFTYCDGIAPALDQTTVNPSPAYIVPVQCATSTDTALTIDYPIALSAVDATGYVDISAGVSASREYVGCKNTELINLDPDGGVLSGYELHFGESNYTTVAGFPSGLIGFTISAPTITSADAFVAQYGGQTHDGTAPSFNTYYTGQFTELDTFGLPSALFQTYLTDQAEQHPFGGAAACATEWTDSRHAFCLTTGIAAGAISSTNLPATPTKAGLADAFFYLPGTGTIADPGGYAAASVTASGASITIYSQRSTNSSNDYSTLPSTVYPVRDMQGTFTSTASADAAAAGFNDGLSTTVFSPLAPVTVFTGVYIDPAVANRGAFLVGAANTTTGSNYWANLTWVGSAWVLGSFADIGTAPTGFGVSASGCIP